MGRLKWWRGEPPDMKGLCNDCSVVLNSLIPVSRDEVDATEAQERAEAIHEELDYLKEIPTRQLVLELMRREGVSVQLAAEGDGEPPMRMPFTPAVYLCLCDWGPYGRHS